MGEIALIIRLKMFNVEICIRMDPTMLTRVTRNKRFCDILTKKVWRIWCDAHWLQFCRKIRNA